MPTLSKERWTERFDVQRWDAREVGAWNMLAARASLMGLVPSSAQSQPLPGLVWDMAVAFESSGLVRRAVRQLREDPGDRQAAVAFLEQALDATEANPVPPHEWRALRDLLGDDLLASLVGISVASLRRYAAETRTTPDDVAARLHWLTLVVADLAGSCNAFGIRRWFRRPRQALDGRSPAELIGGRFDPDGLEAQQVRALAAALTSLGAA